MDKQYSHRNGETEPPTIEGWYFLKQHGNAKWAANPAHPLVLVMTMNHELEVWTWGKETPVKDIKARWWGPVTLPWDTAGREVERES